MKARVITALAAAVAAMTLVPSAAPAQRQPPTPDQRLDRLERQVQEMQRQVFPKGRPADTAGFSDDPAATQSSVMTLDQRLDALERQMTDLLRQSEENGNHLRALEGSVGRMQTDEDQRMTALEQRMNEAAAAAAPAVPTDGLAPVPANPPPAKPKAAVPKKSAGTPAPPPAVAASTPAAAPGVDPGEDAYSEGFRLWQAGQYDQAITTLRAFTSAYPKHHRVSWANNLIGRALLDKGDANGAAAALLANYRSNPGGERAADSLYYLGQALMKLGQPGQACRVYSEFDAVYGAKARPDLKKLETDAKAQAQCT